MNLSNMNKLFLVLSIFWILLIFWLSDSPNARGVGGLLGFLPYGDKFAHAGVFGILAILLKLAGFNFWYAVFITSVYGLTDEFHQYFVAGRTADIFDWLTDSFAAFVTLVLVGGLGPANPKDS